MLEEEGDFLGVPLGGKGFVAGEGETARLCLIFCRGETPSPAL